MAALSADVAVAVASAAGPDGAVDGRFEGPEKILEVDFVPCVGRPEGLRGIGRAGACRAGQGLQEVLTDQSQDGMHEEVVYLGYALHRCAAASPP